MNKLSKFVLPSPNFNKAKDDCKQKPHFLTPSGMSLLPRGRQPPPMYGKHGATVPARYLPQQSCDIQQQRAKKDPVEKQYCESCELEFHSGDDLKRHRAQHEKCPVDGCNYKGHPSVMDKHINALHTSGLFEKFKKLSSPEEIAAWREERRKRYPTLANVLLKQKAQEQRQKRGERLEANKSRFGKVNDRKRAHADTIDRKQDEDKRPNGDNLLKNKNNKRNRKTRYKHNLRDLDKTSVQETEVKGDVEDKQGKEDILMCCGIKAFTGTSQLRDYKHFNDKKKALNNNVLFGLVGMYGSDDDDDDESDDDDYKHTNQTSTEIVNIKLEKGDTLEDNMMNVGGDTEILENTKAKTNKLNDSQVDNKEDFQLSLVSKNISFTDIKTEEVGDNLYLNADKSHSEIEEFEPKLTQVNNLNKNVPASDNYEDSSDEGPEEAPIQKTSDDFPLKSETITSTVPNIEPPVKRKLEEEPKAILKQRILAKRKHGLYYRKARLRKQNTMLEKLLEADIRHERNVLLQCVRYVCENNFFGIGQSTKEGSISK